MGKTTSASDPAPELKRAEKLAAKGRFHEAEKEIRAAIARRGDRPSLYARLGEVLEARAKSKEALEAYEKAVRLDKRYAPGFIGRGRIRMFDLCDGDGALKDLTKALTLDPGEADAWFLRGLCRLGTQHFEEAQQDFAEALKLDPALKDRIDKAVLDFMKNSDLSEA